MSQFDGMSIREMDGMPHLMEADLAKLGVGREAVPLIARDQEAYVRSVYERCPGWRWRKKRKLAGAVRYAALVRKMVGEAVR